MKRIVYVFILLISFGCAESAQYPANQITVVNHTEELEYHSYTMYSRTNIVAENVSTKMITDITYTVNGTQYVYTRVLLPNESFYIVNYLYFNGTDMVIVIESVTEYRPWG